METRFRHIGGLLRVLFVVAIMVQTVFICDYVTHPNRTEKHVAPKPISEDPLTIEVNPGRLGNQMFSFATLLGLSRLNGRNMHVMPENYDALTPFFDVQYPVVNLSTFHERLPWKIGNWLTPADHAIPLASNIINGNWCPTSFTFFHHVRERIRHVFRFRTSFIKYAQDVLMLVKKTRPWTQVYVGVHVRRGDFLKRSQGGWLRGFEGREVDAEFFQQAVLHFRRKYDNVSFLAVSDDRDWCRQNLSRHGILTAPVSPGPGHDLALLSECNHTIMTYGTYGFWGGYLCGGDVVYFSDFLKPNTKMTLEYFVYDKMYLPEWVGISTTPPGFWESYTNPFIQ